MDRTVRAAAVTIVSMLVVLLGAQSPAAAHNSLVSSNPKNGAVLDKAPTEAVLTFLAKLDPRTTKVAAAGPGGASAAAGPARFDGPTAMLPVRATAAGAYTVSYEVASSDGHPIRGTVVYTLTAAAVPSPTPAAPATTADVPPRTSAAPGAGAGTPAASNDSMPWWPWALGGAVVLAAIGVGGVLTARRRRATDR